MTAETVDIAVVGAGPAGTNAACCASRHGLAVLVIDENPAAGGQIYRAPASESAKMAPGGWDRAEGEALRAQLAASGVRTMFGCRVWTVSRSPLRLEIAGPAGRRSIEPRAIVIATGATERVWPFPGWTLPGVIGLAGATALMKAHAIIPPAPVIIAGCGPLLLAVAAEIIHEGGRVGCIVDLAGRNEWARAAPMLMTRPDLLARGLGWVAALGRAGVRVLSRHAIVAANGDHALREVTVCPLDSESRPDLTRAKRLTAAALAVGHGLTPAFDLAALFGAGLEWRADESAWVPVRDRDGRTTVPMVYVAGDGSGIRGAAAAVLSGGLAGLTAAYDLGAVARRAFERETAPMRDRLRRAERFGTAMLHLMRPRPGLIEAMPPETVVCRCEDITRAAIETAIRGGARDLNQIKVATRCGMGPCQGRVCGPAVAALAARHPGFAQPILPWTVRPPLRPLPIADLVGGFTYDDIPQPKPAI